MRFRLVGRIVAGAAMAACAVLSQSCHWWQQQDDGPLCDDALDVICGCASRPCDRANPPGIVHAMQRCDRKDVRPSDYEGNIHICITDEGDGFCRVLDGLLLGDGSICSARCHQACSPQLEAQCESMQYSKCDVP